MAFTYRSTQQICDISIDVVTSVTSIETVMQRRMRDYMILRDIVRLFYFATSYAARRIGVNHRVSSTMIFKQHLLYFLETLQRRVI